MVDQGLGNFFQPNALTIIEHTNNGGLGPKEAKTSNKWSSPRQLLK